MGKSNKNAILTLTRRIAFVAFFLSYKEMYFFSSSKAIMSFTKRDTLPFPLLKPVQHQVRHTFSTMHKTKVHCTPSVERL